MGGIYKTGPAFEGVIANTGVQYVGLPSSNGEHLAIQIVYRDATTDVTVELETTNKPQSKAAVDSTAAQDWADESTTINTPTTGAADTKMTHLSQVASKRSRLKITANADSDIEVWVHGKE